MRPIGKTDKGRRRKNNQDIFSVGELPVGKVVIVCDGMGGVSGGGYASTKCSDTIDTYLRRMLASSSNVNLRSVMLGAIYEANKVLYNISNNNPVLKGMGTTAVVCLRGKDKLHIAYVGDSRCYMIRNKKMTQLTRDHSVVWELVELGRITPEEAKLHPDRHVITKAVGVEQEIQPEYKEVSVKESDIIVACTDGLHGYLDETEIYDIIVNNEPEKAVSMLVEQVNMRGGPDNITVVIF